MGGIKQEQSDASQQPKASHSADQPQDEVSTSGQDEQDFHKGQCIVLRWRINTVQIGKLVTDLIATLK